MSRPLALCGAGALLLAAAHAGCGEQKTAPLRGDAEAHALGGSGGTNQDAGAAGQPAQAGAAGQPTQAGMAGQPAQAGAAGKSELPWGVGADWQTYSVPDTICSLYFMPKGGTPPPPVAWGDCNPEGLQDVACKQAKPESGETIEARLWDPWTSPASLTLVRTREASKEYRLERWSPDGTFHWALAHKGAQSCSFGNNRDFDGSYVLQHIPDGDQGKLFVIAGRGAETPRYQKNLVLPPNNGVIASYSGSENWIMNSLYGTIRASPWKEDDEQVIYSTSMHSSGLPAHVAFGHSDEIFLKLNASGRFGWVSWTPQKGIQDLLIKQVTKQRGFVSLGTDGKDMVFTYGEEAKSEYQYERRTLFRAAYTSTPATLEASAVALANLPNHNPVYPWAVGCGYAAIGAYDPAEGVNLLITRLSDGMMWKKWPLKPHNFGGIIALGITCEEVFINAGHLGVFQRIALDSLGSGALSPPQPKDWPFPS